MRILMIVRFIFLIVTPAYSEDMSYISCSDSEFDFGVSPGISPESIFSSIVNCIAIDMHNNMWVGTTNNGLLKYNGKTWTNYTVDDGLPGNYEITVAVDANNKI